MIINKITIKKENFMKQIAILSDTHGLLREPVIAELNKADCSIHAGDINTPYIAESIRQLGETYVVRGNNDKEWAEALPKSITVTIEGVRFFIVHNKEDVPKYLTNIDVVVYGHSHKYSAEIIGGVLFLNPGSCFPFQSSSKENRRPIIQGGGFLCFYEFLSWHVSQSIFKLDKKFLMR
jgi:putative phosphoesterase